MLFKIRCDFSKHPFYGDKLPEVHGRYWTGIHGHTPVVRNKEDATIFNEHDLEDILIQCRIQGVTFKAIATLEIYNG